MKRLAWIGLFVALVVPAVMAGAKETKTVKPWDQEAVTALGTKLQSLVSSIYTAAYKDPTGGDLPGFMGNPHFQFMDTLRVLRSEALHYRAILRKGTGRDASFPVVKRLNELNDDIVEDALQIHLDAPVPDQLAELKKLMAEINAYYGYRGAEI